MNTNGSWFCFSSSGQLQHTPLNFEVYIIQRQTEKMMYFADHKKRQVIRRKIQSSEKKIWTHLRTIRRRGILYGIFQEKVRVMVLKVRKLNIW
jgi:ribosomal protein L36